MPQLILYSKPGCHLCEGLAEKLAQLSHLPIDLEVRDITQNPVWFENYRYDIPVLCRVVKSPTSQGDFVEQPLPRLSPRAPVSRLERMLQTYLGSPEAQ